MTREKALQVDRLLHEIEDHEALKDELLSIDLIREIEFGYFDTSLEDELLAVVQARLDRLLKLLEEM